MAPKRRGGSGGIGRRTAMALIAGGGLLGVSSTGAFDQVQSDRGFGVTTAESQNAENSLLYIKKMSPKITGSEESAVPILVLENRFPETTDEEDDTNTFNSISVTVPDASRKDLISINIPEFGSTFAPKDQITITGDITLACGDPKEIPLSIIVTGSSERIETSRTVSIDADLDCPPACPISTGATALGSQNGDPNVELDNTEIDGDVSANDGFVDLHKVSVNGDVSASEWIKISGANNEDYRICGSIESDGYTEIGNHVETGSITSGSYVEVGNNSIVHGDIDAEGSVTIKPNGEVKGKISEGNTDGSTEVEKFECVEIRDKTTGGVFVFRINNITSKTVEVTGFGIDATAISSNAVVNDKNASEIEIKRAGNQNGEADRNGNNRYRADGTQFNLDTNAIISASTSDADVDIRRIRDSDGNQLNLTSLTKTTEANADLTVTLVFSSGNQQSFFFKDDS